MGKARRVVPRKMPGKLKIIRDALELSLEMMVKRLESELSDLDYPDVKLYSGYITEFEQGKREPILPVLLAYGRASKINVERLIDDRDDLSAKDINNRDYR